MASSPPSHSSQEVTHNASSSDIALAPSRTTGGNTTRSYAMVPPPKTHCSGKAFPTRQQSSSQGHGLFPPGIPADETSPSSKGRSMLRPYLRAAELDSTAVSYPKDSSLALSPASPPRRLSRGPRTDTRGSSAPYVIPFRRSDYSRFARYAPNNRLDPRLYPQSWMFDCDIPSCYQDRKHVRPKIVLRIFPEASRRMEEENKATTAGLPAGAGVAMSTSMVSTQGRATSYTENVGVRVTPRRIKEELDTSEPAESMDRTVVGSSAMTVNGVDGGGAASAGMVAGTGGGQRVVAEQGQHVSRPGEADRGVTTQSNRGVSNTVPVSGDHVAGDVTPPFVSPVAQIETMAVTRNENTTRTECNDASCNGSLLRRPGFRRHQDYSPALCRQNVYNKSSAKENGINQETKIKQENGINQETKIKQEKQIKQENAEVLTTVRVLPAQQQPDQRSAREKGEKGSRKRTRLSTCWQRSRR